MMLKLRQRSGPLLIHLLMIAGSIVMMYPLVFSLAVSFMTEREYSQVSWFPLPSSLYLGNYALFFGAAADSMFTWIVNTLIRIVWYIVVPGITSILCGYVFSRLRFRGRNTVFMIFLSSLLLPGIVYQIPLFIMMARWPLAGGNDIWGQGGSGFVNEWPILLLPGLVNVFYIFLFRQSFYAIPADYEDAARLDGASTRQVLWHVYLPLLKAPIAVMAIFQSVAIWNDYVWPWISVGGNPDVWPAALGFQQVMARAFQVPGMQVADVPFLLTIATLASIPPVLIFLFLQRYFVQGLQGFGLKG